MTFSISARCAETGAFALAVSSSSPAVAARCAFARAGVGAVATQNVTDPTLGPAGLDLMADGHDAKAALAQILATRPHLAYRQLALIDSNGGTATHCGANTLGTYATAEGRDCVAVGNLLANEGVPAAMVAAFEASTGPLAERVLGAMAAAVAAGGEAGPVHSAGLMMVRDVPWPIADLRIDWTEADPIAELTALWHVYAPQLEDYVIRGLDPTAAPSYGVPGDL